MPVIAEAAMSQNAFMNQLGHQLSPARLRIAALALVAIGGATLAPAAFVLGSGSHRGLAFLLSLIAVSTLVGGGFLFNKAAGRSSRDSILLTVVGLAPLLLVVQIAVKLIFSVLDFLGG